MPSLFARTVFVACLVLSAMRLACADQKPFSAVADGIDKVCTPAMAGTTTRSPVYLIRLGDGSGGFGPWQRSSPTAESRAENVTFFHGDDFATVREGVAIFTASVVHHSSFTPQIRTESWCFTGGELSRATVDTIDPDVGVEYRHTQYFDRDVDLPTWDYNESLNMRGLNGPVPKPSPAAVLVTHYKTPADLPFYSEYQAASASQPGKSKP